MVSTIAINQLEVLPWNCLVIMKDNIGSSDIFSLCLKANNIDSSSLAFKITFVSTGNIPICILMIKSKKVIYKCLIGFNTPKEFEYLKNLMKQKTFNLFLFSDNKKEFIVKINNSDGDKFLSALSSIKSTILDISTSELESAKQQILKTYSDDELWNLFVIK